MQASSNAVVAAAARAPGPATAQRLPLREAMLAGPILPTMLRFALPTVAVLVAQTMVGIAETFYVSFLGTEALAGVALVFPVLMLMQMMSNGGVGGGVASSIARAIGAGRRDDADALLFHALIIAVIAGVLFTAGALLFGRALYSGLGGHGAALDAAVLYSGLIFVGAVLIWLTNLASAALRGVGNVKAPAWIILAGSALTIPLSPAFIFGFGPFPRLGVAGAGVTILLYYLGSTTALFFYLRSGYAGLNLRWATPEWRLFKDILRVGLLSALGTLQSNLTVVLVTGAVGAFGIEALAGYGTASRLDYVVIPLMFGLGTALVTMVGTNVGAGQLERARRIAWTGAIFAALVLEAIGLFVAVLPQAWMGLFTNEPAVLATGALYLREVGPFYGFVGLALLIYFASQGAGTILWPFLAGTLRLLIAAVIGWIAVTRFNASLSVLFALVAASSVAYAAICAAALMRSGWGKARA
ncbi:MAG: MATE family efflux transporter [Methylobacteriaceae bacterium]|nr:MATE family efflux transporter [Methylobacteriaceae bacterium]